MIRAACKELIVYLKAFLQPKQNLIFYYCQLSYDLDIITTMLRHYFSDADLHHNLLIFEIHFDFIRTNYKLLVFYERHQYFSFCYLLVLHLRLNFNLNEVSI